MYGYKFHGERLKSTQMLKTTKILTFNFSAFMNEFNNEKLIFLHDLTGKYSKVSQFHLFCFTASHEMSFGHKKKYQFL